VQFDPAPPDAEGFDSRFVIYEGDDDVSGIGCRLGSNDGDISRENSCIDHAFTAYR